MGIAYSDGSAMENEIRELFLAQDDLRSSTPIASERYDVWPIRYHCSPVRANLLRHMDFSGLDVLELGAGMGAISRYLAESAKSLTVVEGTESRYAALSARLRDLTNWQGHVGNIQDVELPQKYDVVCVIGVLEYAELYVTPPEGTDETPFTWFLKRAARHLKDDGVLVVAIENKLGMKYFGGAPEDHTHRLFDGICGYPLTKSPRTFSRKEFTELLRQTGFRHVDQYFPFPDYKVPTSILSSQMIDTVPEIAADIAASQQALAYGVPRSSMFPDALAAHSIAQAGLLADLSNSFMFCACGSKESAIRRGLLSRTEAGELAWHFSVNRKQPTKTVFSLAKPSSLSQTSAAESLVSVTKTLLFPENSETDSLQKKEVGTIALPSGSASVLWQALTPTTITTGRSLRYDLINHAYFEQWPQFLAEFQTFFSWSFQHWADRENNATEYIQGEALDALFSNAIPNRSGDASVQNAYHLIDLEWTLNGRMPKSWFIMRNVVRLMPEASVFTPSAPFASFAGLYEHLCAVYAVTPNLSQDSALEVELQRAVTWADNPLDKPTWRQLLEGILQSPFGPGLLPRDPTAEFSRWVTMQDLNSRVTELGNTLNTRPHRLASKISRRLRRLRR
jgi:2-polyprenyl-3-methyl-5-hydroxy-6-metoxy-1,4-benzoquinol methylase